MKILVTGGAGYLGSILVPELLAVRHRVTVLDNFMYRQNSLAAVCADPHFSVVKGDCRDHTIMRPLIEAADVIIPLAAIVGAPACENDVNAAVSTNRQAIEMIAAYAAPSQAVIMPNTNSGYGSSGEAECTEETPTRYLSVYAATKGEAERHVMRRQNAISLRLATVFGAAPRMRLDLMVNDFVYRAVSDRALVLFQGNFRRNFVHVRDVARAVLHAIDRFDDMKGQVYNVGDSRANMSKAELCGKIKERLPDFVYFESPLSEDPDKRDYLVSNAKIEATGWRPQYSIDDGIDELAKLYRTLRPNHYVNA